VDVTLRPTSNVSRLDAQSLTLVVQVRQERVLRVRGDGGCLLPAAPIHARFPDGTAAGRGSRHQCQRSGGGGALLEVRKFVHGDARRQVAAQAARVERLCWRLCPGECVRAATCAGQSKPVGSGAGRESELGRAVGGAPGCGREQREIRGTAPAAYSAAKAAYPRGNTALQVGASTNLYRESDDRYQTAQQRSKPT